MILIQEHNAKPSIKPLFEKPTFSSNFLGVELEVEVSPELSVENCALKVNEILGDFVVLKEDGSLYRGFEICSRPASLESHKEKWRLLFKNLKGDINSYFLDRLGKKTETCGMHVHINRQPLSDLQIGKIVSFIHRKENYEFIKTIAERESNRYCNFNIERGLNSAKHENYILLDRRVGVNLHNRETVEIRIFKSPTEIESFTKNLEFCDALIHFTFPARATIKDGTDHKKFIEFVKNYKDNYPNLINFLERKKYL